MILSAVPFTSITPSVCVKPLPATELARETASALTVIPFPATTLNTVPS